MPTMPSMSACTRRLVATPRWDRHAAEHPPWNARLQTKLLTSLTNAFGCPRLPCSTGKFGSVRRRDSCRWQWRSRGSIERQVLLQPPGAQDTVRSTSETSENASSWRIFLRPCSSKRFPSSSCAFMLSLSSPSVETLVHIRRWVPAAGHQSLLRGCGQRNVLGECREGCREAWLHVTR